MKPLDPAVSLKLKGLKVILLDVDGVLTDGRVILGPSGFEAKFFDAKDGHRIRLARRAGLHVFFVTGRSSEAVESRADELDIDGAFQGILDKTTVLEEIAVATRARLEEMAFMGDDLVDLPAMRLVGLSCCPADAAAEVIGSADLVTDAGGGRGAAGQFIELVLKVQGKWEEVTSKYLL